MVRQILKAHQLFYRLPRQHHKHLKSTNMLERLNEEIRRRTHVVRIFPNGESCLRLVRALAVETHENWLERDGHGECRRRRRSPTTSPARCTSRSFSIACGGRQPARRWHQGLGGITTDIAGVV